MAQVTVELRKLLQLNNFELFDFPYQFDDLNFKKQIEQAVIDYYYNYEIGVETPQEFKRRFEAKFLSIIGYYNQLYNTTLLEYNPLINYKLTEALDQLSTSNNSQDTSTNTASTGQTDSTAQTDSDSTVTSDRNSKASDYPQQSIVGGDFLSGEQVDTGTDQTDSTVNNTANINSEDTSETTGTLTAEGTESTNYEKTIEGLTGTSYQELITKERQNLIRIIPMIISELKPLFILVY